MNVSAAKKPRTGKARSGPSDAWKRMEVVLGGVQLRAMERAIALAAGVRPDRTSEGVAFAARPHKKGLPIAAIHGFGGDKETWLMMSALMPRSRGMVLIDLPGHGQSSDIPESQATIRHHAEAVLRVLDRAGHERALICGNSMGGGVALRLASSWPDRVAGLVLVASVGRDVHRGPALGWTTDNHGLPSAANNPLIPRPEDVDRFMELVLERPPPVGKAVIRYVITQRAARAETLNKLFRGFVHNGGDAGVPDELHRIDTPALIIHGEQDRIISKHVAEDLVQALPRSELVVMRGVGHAPQLEAPRHTARLVENFVRRLETR